MVNKLPQALAQTKLNRGKRACTGGRSAAMPVLGRRGAVEVWILAAREAAVQIMWAGLHLLPRRAHDAFDRLLRQRAALALLATRLLPVVEQRVVERAEAAFGGRSRMSLMDSELRSRNAWRMASTSM